MIVNNLDIIFPKFPNNFRPLDLALVLCRIGVVFDDPSENGILCPALEAKFSHFFNLYLLSFEAK